MDADFVLKAIKWVVIIGLAVFFAVAMPHDI